MIDVPAAARASRRVAPAAPQRSRHAALRMVLSLAMAATAAPLASPALAQAAKSNAVSTSAAISGLGTFSTNLDNDGGSFSWAGVIASGSIGYQVNPEWSVGFNLGYQYEHWSFSSPTAFGGTAPWGSINRPSVGFNVAYQAKPDLSFFVSPQFEWDYETNATASGQNFGAVLGATRIFARDKILGVGVGIFHQINETKAFPFLIVNWQLDDRWRIANPFRAGPAGGAGLELVYALDGNWELAGGGTYRDYRFRLSDNGPHPDGIGQNQGIPLFARLTRKLGPTGRLDFYAGATVAGTLKLRDPGGNTQVSSDYNAAPFIALTLAGDF